MQIVKAKPNLQPIDQNAYDLKLNGKEGIAVLGRGERLYTDFSKMASVKGLIDGQRTQALFDGHWLVHSARDFIDECDLETGKVKRNFDFPGSRIFTIVGFQNFFTFDQTDKGVHLWDIRKPGNAPCLNIPLSNFHRRPQIINSAQILVTFDESTKIHVIDLRNSSPVQTIAAPDHGKKFQNFVKVSSFVHEGGNIIVSYSSGMLAEFNLSRYKFTLTGLKAEWAEAVSAIMEGELPSEEKWELASRPANSSYCRLKVCDSIIVGEKHESNQRKGLNFIHRNSFKILGSLSFDSAILWDYQERRFVHKTDRNKLQIWDF